jgi:signal transduction histidine kinase
VRPIVQIDVPELQESRLENARLENRTRRNWIVLMATSILSTLGLAVAVAPMLGTNFVELWPWVWTNHTLLAGLSLAVTALVWYLTNQERRVTSLRSQLHDTRLRELRHCKSYGRALASANTLLHREIRERKRAEKELLSLNETLEDRVAERTHEAEAHADELRVAKKSLEQQNARLRELYQTAHQFVDNVSHEFRTPLTVIREYASAVSEGLTGPTTPEQREYLATIMNRVDDLSVMVNDLLDISRIEADLLRTSRRTCRVPDIVERVRNIVERKATNADVPLEIDIDENALPLVYCDAEKIGRALINLVVNAVKFSTPGAPVRVWASLKYDRREVVLGVTDQGPGIARENLEAIFERFKQIEGNVRRSTRGFGLGLNIVRELVYLNFGSIAVESELNSGSTFSFTVPVDDPQKLLPVYLGRVRLVRGPAVLVGILTAVVEEECDVKTLDAVHYFIEDHMRSTDLVFRPQPGTWLLVAVMHEQRTDQMIARLQGAQQEANGSRNNELPPLKWAVEGMWHIEEEGDTFVQNFLATYEKRKAAPSTQKQAESPKPTPTHESS